MLKKGYFGSWDPLKCPLPLWRFGWTDDDNNDDWTVRRDLNKTMKKVDIVELGSIEVAVSGGSNVTWRMTMYSLMH